LAQIMDGFIDRSQPSPKMVSLLKQSLKNLALIRSVPNNLNPIYSNLDIKTVSYGYVLVIHVRDFDFAPLVSFVLDGVIFIRLCLEFFCINNIHGENFNNLYVIISF
jgi:hypothetical protein